jgi:hypothetical protein
MVSTFIKGKFTVLYRQGQTLYDKMGKPKLTHLYKTLANQHRPNTKMAMEMGLELVVDIHFSFNELE